jgi:DNA invertase Pin-like site-specific DNA recombinase
LERYMNTKNSSVSSNGSIRCAIYARTATTTATEIDAAIVEQIDRCREAAKKNGWTVVEDCIRIDRGRSGISMKGRNGLNELIALAATRPRPFDKLICASTDRVARSWTIVSTVIDTLMYNGVSLHFASHGLDTSDPQFRDIICCACGQDDFYLKSHGDRVRRGKLGSKLKKAQNAAALAATVSVQ